MYPAPSDICRNINMFTHNATLAGAASLTDDARQGDSNHRILIITLVMDQAGVTRNDSRIGKDGEASVVELVQGVPKRTTP